MKTLFTYTWSAIFVFWGVFPPPLATLPCKTDHAHTLWCETDTLYPPPVTQVDSTRYSDDNINLSTLFGYSPAHSRTHRALELCEDNIACAHSILHHQALSPGQDCWVCRRMRQRFSVTPLSSQFIHHLHYEQALGSDSNCSLSPAMLMLLQIALAHSNDDFSLFPPHNISCMDTGKTVTHFETLLVPVKKAETCICGIDGHHVGYSQCDINIIVGNMTSSICLITWKNATTYKFTCPFSKLTSTPGLFWVCGKHAFANLPLSGWSSCCYPAIIQPAVTMYAAETEERPHGPRVDYPHRSKRSGNKYLGYILANPFTSQSETVGWGLFPFGGVVAAFQKINQLAVELLTLTNETTASLAALNSEQFQIREAVLQNRFVLDTLEAKAGGVCKVIGLTDCCFYIQNNYDNVSSAIGRMQDAVREPLPADDFASYLQNLGWGWLTWTAGVILPILIPLVLCLLVLQCCLIPLVKQFVHRLFSRERDILLTEPISDPEWLELYPLRDQHSNLP